MTTEEARKMLGVNSDNALAKKIKTTRQAVSLWRGVVPELREYQIRELARSGPQ